VPERGGVSRRAFFLLGAAGGLGAAAGGGALAYLFRRVNSIGRFSPDALERVRDGRTNPLFQRFPGLATSIPWTPLGIFPTPVERMAEPAGPGAATLWVKRDDAASPLYGGNKVRKLEHLLAEARLAGKDTLITLGAIGSNHGLATAIHGSALGFEVDLALYDQPVTPFVRRNLAGFVASGARVHEAGSVPGALFTASVLHARHTRSGRAPYFVMVGGSSRLGCIGYVVAALELADQIAAGAIPEPDRLFVPLGTCGTVAGLVVGLKLAGLRTRVSAVRVVEPFPASAATVRYLAQDLADTLHAADPQVPHLRIGEDDFDVVTDHFGGGYGYPTAQGEAAIRWAAPQLALETTYSGKALAACLDFCRGSREGGNVLFWNTFSSAPVPIPASLDPLPPRLRRIAEG
jgi:D-cysteine desulfhydrase